METDGYVVPRRVGVKLDIIANGIGGKEAINSSGDQQLLGNDFFQKSLRILEELARLGIFQDGRVAPPQLPRMEEW